VESCGERGRWGGTDLFIYLLGGSGVLFVL